MSKRQTSKGKLAQDIYTHSLVIVSTIRGVQGLQWWRFGCEGLRGEVEMFARGRVTIMPKAATVVQNCEIYLGRGARVPV